LNIPTTPKPKCVVKHLQPSNPAPEVLELAKQLFEREASTLYKLGNLHPQIPKLSEHFQENGEFYLVQEFIDGKDLSYEIVPGTKLSEADTIQLLQEILEVLAVVHQNNIIHRDIKPQNIMRRSDRKIILIDFGAVKEIKGLSMSQAQALDALTGLKGKPKVAKPKTQQTTTTQGTDISRRQTLKILAGVGAGFGLAVVGGKLFSGGSQEISTTPEQNSGVSKIPDSSTAPSSVTKTATKSNLSLQTLNFETVTVDNKGTINNRKKLSAKYISEDLGNGVTLEMVQIPGGTFTMGSPSSEAGRSDEESPQRQVKVPWFFMGRYEVTQAQYQAIMGNNPASFKGANKPVEKVSWDDAVEFCNKISQKTGRTYRLPSEAEWEYACRAGTTTPFYFGGTITTDLANYDGTATPYSSAPKGVSRQETTEVGKFPPNAFGLYDMHGNVYEWCQDVWNDNYSQAPTDGSARLNGNDNQRKLLRGGCWFVNPVLCRSAFRFTNSRDNRNIFSGFRIVLFLL
jgi:eukaryotic-like serine/threonine-protein kinase